MHGMFRFSFVYVFEFRKKSIWLLLKLWGIEKKRKKSINGISLDVFYMFCCYSLHHLFHWFFSFVHFISVDTRMTISFCFLLRRWLYLKKKFSVDVELENCCLRFILFLCHFIIFSLWLNSIGYMGAYMWSCMWISMAECMRK